jgi:hypothetical protein
VRSNGPRTVTMPSRTPAEFVTKCLNVNTLPLSPRNGMPESPAVTNAASRNRCSQEWWKDRSSSLDPRDRIPSTQTFEASTFEMASSIVPTTHNPAVHAWRIVNHCTRWPESSLFIGGTSMSRSPPHHPSHAGSSAQIRRSRLILE